MVIGSLAVNVVANISKFNSNLRQAQVGLNSFVARTTSQVTSLQGVMAGIATGAVASFIVRTIEAAEALQDMADRLGVNVESLQMMRYAAEQMGSSASTLDRSLGFLNKTVGEALRGNEAAIKTFARLGVDLDSLRKMKPDEMFLAMVDAIGKIPNEAEQAAAAEEVFGKAGQEMLPMLRAGREEVERMQKRLEEMGGVASAEAVRKLAELGNQMKDLKALISAFSTEAIAAFSPFLVNEIDKVTNALTLMMGVLKIINDGLNRIEQFGGFAGMAGQAAKAGFPLGVANDPMAAGGAGYDPEGTLRMGKLPALVKGTSAAFTASLENKRPQGARGGDPLKAIANQTKATADNSTKQVALLTKIANNPGGGGGPMIVAGTLGA